MRCFFFLHKNDKQNYEIQFKNNNLKITFSSGCLGSRNDEERSEMRYVMWIAEFSESSNLWTQVALPGTPGSISAWVSVSPICSFFLFLAERRERAVSGCFSLKKITSSTVKAQTLWETSCMMNSHEYPSSIAPTHKVPWITVGRQSTKIRPHVRKEDPLNLNI